MRAFSRYIVHGSTYDSMQGCRLMKKKRREYLFPIHTQMGQASEKGYIFFVVLCWMISFIKIQGFLFDSLIEDERFGTLDMLCQAMY